MAPKTISGSMKACRPHAFKHKWNGDGKLWALEELENAWALPAQRPAAPSCPFIGIICTESLAQTF